MARYIDVEGYRKLFDEEYKKTRELICEGETHLDNLAEGFSEASRVIDRIPTADVAPRAEVERLERILNSYTLQYGTVRDKQKVIDEAKSEVAREIFEELEERIAVRTFTSKSEDYADGCFDTIEWVDSKIAELKKKYMEENE